MSGFNKTARYLAIVLLAFAFTTGCAATVTSGRMGNIWTQVRAETPHCQREMPRVVWLGEPMDLIMDGSDITAYGAYVRGYDVVLLAKGWADEEVVAHEFAHACGEDLGERAARFADPAPYRKLLKPQPE